MKWVLISLALFPACGTGMASDHTENRQLIHNQLRMDRQYFHTLQILEFLQWQWSAGVENRAFLDARASQLRQSMQPGERPVDAVLVLVSFSVPPDELKRRIEDAAEFNIPVVIRGMVNGDTRAATNAIASPIKESNTGGMQIDPTTFRKHSIIVVPVLIVACGSQDDIVDRLQKDLTLHQALKRVAEVGDCVDTARNLLCEEVRWNTTFLY